MPSVLYRIEFQFKTFPSLNIHWASWFHFPVVIQVDFQLTNGRQREKEGGRQRGWRGESSRRSGPEPRERRGRERGEERFLSVEVLELEELSEKRGR